MIELLITVQGVVRALYTEAIPMSVLGLVQIERASHVEPDTSGRWWADLEPSRGPILGPYTLRSQALQAEHDWLTQHVLFGSPDIEQKVENPTDDEQASFEVPPVFDAAEGCSIQTAPCGLNLL